MTVVLAVGFGVVMGVLLGLLGGGGSILAVPALVFGLGMEMREAIPVSLVVVGTASAVGVLPKLRVRQVDWRLAGVFVVTGIPATFAGTAVGKLLPQRALLIGFALVMVVAGARMLADRRASEAVPAGGESARHWRRLVTRAAPAGLAVGFLTGLFGVGGGFLIIPALVLLLGVDMPVAVGTSLVIIVVNSVSGLVSHLAGTSIDWTITVIFTAAAIAGSLGAGYLGARVSTDRLQRWFAYLIYAVALYTLVEAIFLK